MSDKLYTYLTTILGFIALMCSFDTDGYYARQALLFFAGIIHGGIIVFILSSDKE